jgi:hypothetical protein
MSVGVERELLGCRRRFVHEKNTNGRVVSISNESKQGDSEVCRMIKRDCVVIDTINCWGLLNIDSSVSSKGGLTADSKKGIWWNLVCSSYMHGGVMN